MRIVTGSIATVLQEHLTIGTTLRQLTGQVTVFLLGVYIGNQAFLCLEVESHLRVLVGIATHLEYRSTHHLMGGRVHLALCMHKVAVETHKDFLTGQIHILVLHLRVTIEVSQCFSCVIGQRVVGRILHR